MTFKFNLQTYVYFGSKDRGEAKEVHVNVRATCVFFPLSRDQSDDDRQRGQGSAHRCRAHLVQQPWLSNCVVSLLLKHPSLALDQVTAFLCSGAVLLLDFAAHPSAPPSAFFACPAPGLHWRN